MFLGHETGHVAAGNLEIRLRQCHLDIGEEGLEETHSRAISSSTSPNPAFLAARIPVRRTTGDDLAGLSPARHPRDGTQVLYASPRLRDDGRGGSPVEPPELLDRGRG